MRRDTHGGLSNRPLCLVVRSGSGAQFLVGGGGDIYTTTAAKQSHLKIASVAICEILFSFLS